MKQTKAPCKQCEDRQLYCHSNCIKYAEWKTEYNKDKLEQEEYKNRDKEYRGYQKAGIERRQRYERRRKS